MMSEDLSFAIIFLTTSFSFLVPVISDINNVNNADLFLVIFLGSSLTLISSALFIVLHNRQEEIDELKIKYGVKDKEWD